MFEVGFQGLEDCIRHAVRLAIAREIHAQNSIGKDSFAITRKTVEDGDQTIVALSLAGTFEEFIKDRADQIRVGWNEPLHTDLERLDARSEVRPICKVNRDLRPQRCTRWRRRTRGCGRI